VRVQLYLAVRVFPGFLESSEALRGEVLREGRGKNRRRNGSSNRLHKISSGTPRTSKYLLMVIIKRKPSRGKNPDRERSDGSG